VGRQGHKSYRNSRLLINNSLCAYHQDAAKSRYNNCIILKNEYYMKSELTNKSADYITKQFQLQNSYTVELSRVRIIQRFRTAWVYFKWIALQPPTGKKKKKRRSIVRIAGNFSVSRTANIRNINYSAAGTPSCSSSTRFHSSPTYSDSCYT
jgi:hypothetical protein